VSLTLLDWEGILQTACKAAAALGVENQVTTKSGDVWSVEYGCDQFDVVWLGDITHFLTPKRISDRSAKRTTRWFMEVQSS